MDPIVVGFVVVALIVAMAWLRWQSGKAEMKKLSPSDSTSVSRDFAKNSLAKIQAPQHHKQTTGGSLSDALRHRDGNKTSPQLPAGLEQELRGYLQEGRKIEAIKRLRQVTGSGLKEAKEVLEQLDHLSNS